MGTRNNNTLQDHEKTMGLREGNPRKDHEIPIHTLTNATLTTNL